MKPKIKINQERQEVFVNGRETHFTRNEYELLLLFRRTTATLTRDEIRQNIQGYKEHTDMRTIDQYITRLRRKIGPMMIRTVRQYGYKWAGN